MKDKIIDDLKLSEDELKELDQPFDDSIKINSRNLKKVIKFHIILNFLINRKII